MGKKKRNEPLWKTWEGWTRFLAVTAFLLSSVGWYWNHLRVVQQLSFTPIEVHVDVFHDSGSNPLVIEFALANTGTVPAILAELCFQPEPWGDSRYDPGTKQNPSIPAGVLIPSSTGIQWLVSPQGEKMSPVDVEPGTLVHVRAYFDLTSYSHKNWMPAESEPMKVAMYATVIDSDGIAHLTRLNDWLTLKDIGQIGLEISTRTDLLPGDSDLQAGAFRGESIGNSCVFPAPLFGPVNR